MKKLLTISLFLISILSLNVSAQTFTFTKNSQQYINSNDTGYYADIVDTGYVNNLTGSVMRIKLQRISVNVPSNWETAICDINACYPPYIDTAVADYPPGISEVTIHFYSHHIFGQGTVTIKAIKVSNPAENHSVTFGASLNPIGIKQISSVINEFRLNQNYPNPFNPATKIGFSVPSSNYVELRVYDILGREIKTLLSQQLNAGEYEIEFDAHNLASGVYYYRLQSGNNVSVKKMTLVK